MIRTRFSTVGHRIQDNLRVRRCLVRVVDPREPLDDPRTRFRVQALYITPLTLHQRRIDEHLDVAAIPADALAVGLAVRFVRSDGGTHRCAPVLRDLTGHVPYPLHVRRAVLG